MNIDFLGIILKINSGNDKTIFTHQKRMTIIMGESVRFVFKKQNLKSYTIVLFFSINTSLGWCCTIYQEENARRKGISSITYNIRGPRVLTPKMC